MNSQNQPFADELLTSWHARRSHILRERGVPDAKPIRDREGNWRHPDVRPALSWLKAVSRHFDVPQTHLAAQSMKRRYPALSLDFLAWERWPFPLDDASLRPAPRLGIAWCSRCLAEDFAAGQTAYIRHDWVMAASGFCHRHRSPLEDQCNACGSFDWRLVAPPRGALRMICTTCWRPLERALPAILNAGPADRKCWDAVICFEKEILAALRGKTPDQFRFNFTSASQLLAEVRDVAGLLSRNHRGGGSTNIPLNAFVCPVMTPGYHRPEFRLSVAPFPLATARVLQRRCLLAAVCAIIDQTGVADAELFGPSAPPAIETFVATVESAALDPLLEISGRWSVCFARRIRMAGRRRSNRISIARLRGSISDLNQIFP